LAGAQAESEVIRGGEYGLTNLDIKDALPLFKDDDLLLSLENAFSIGEVYDWVVSWLLRKLVRFLLRCGGCVCGVV